ncbi:hypothetical protein P175DRAFT_0560490 [Aspergillus ochraceoroseus IBT 24754]|uniref:Uncharacterized protein n=3 Tax=Aspergillus subgen. Nidulantes TaxID=2720870 RepID=A0A0F8UCI2_9EURO|nr:uncharacterized protein P175DRAFT_0560490 [Aspergillus ochraceoroseus IBT 24754]KKK13384.1 hypothetical protein AOCH_004965 [Aspergillus ochraceoroseus]KKK17429.1 hypothetical protein ARAM_005175 [Aspergillus rambellii]PTU17797.1 hypothetical protein P175DRAFT_0560490 [Aspergillus ochraceoroseus IBT 24754]
MSNLSTPHVEAGFYQRAQMSASRSDEDKRRLRDNAMMLLSGYEKVQIAPDETTGEDDFKYADAPAVCAVVVDKGSGVGYAQITGGGKKPDIVYTGRGETGYKLAHISTGQTCMLYGRPTVLYVYPQP